MNSDQRARRLADSRREEDVRKRDAFSSRLKHRHRVIVEQRDSQDADTSNPEKETR